MIYIKIIVLYYNNIHILGAEDCIKEVDEALWIEAYDKYSIYKNVIHSHCQMFIEINFGIRTYNHIKLLVIQ